MAKAKQQELAARVEELSQALAEHNYRYHVLSSPTVSDAEYDKLFQELQAIEAEHPELAQPNSPTHRVGGYISERFVKVRHPGPILSLSNAFSTDDVRAWYDRIRRLDDRVEAAEFVLEPKIDGLTVVLHYEQGAFVRGATRGDGEIGEDITPNLRTVRALPLRIPVADKKLPVPVRLVVRGEAVIYTQDFERMNAALQADGKNTYVNPRNTASGALRQLDSSLTAARPISLLCYAVVEAEGVRLPTQWEVLNYLRQMGFPVAALIQKFADIEAVIAFLEANADIRDQLPFEADGLVIKINDLGLSADLGVVGKDPRGAIAFKWPAREATTVLQDIGVNVGRTGVLTPYAILEPVAVGGVTVRQATLHNFDFIKEKDIRIGDRVWIKRAGEVIPYVIGPILETRTGAEKRYRTPRKCPSCGERVERAEGEVAYFCVNSACPAQLTRLVEHFAAVLDIVGFGEKLAVQVVAEGVVKDLADIFLLEKDKLLELEGFAEKKAQNLVDSIAAARTRLVAEHQLGRMISALGIRSVGEVAANDLAAQFGSLDELRVASAETLQEVDGIGPIVAQAVIDWIQSPQNLALLDKLKSLGVWPTGEKRAARVSEGALAGETFVITGTLPNWSREAAKAFIEDHGGKVTDSISKKTSYLVLGEAPGSKLAKAQSLGVPIVDEAGLRNLGES